MSLLGVLEDQTQSHSLPVAGWAFGDDERSQIFFFFFFVSPVCYMIGSNTVTLTLQAHTLII